MLYSFPLILSGCVADERNEDLFNIQTYGHVKTSTSKGACEGLDKLPGNPEIGKADYTFSGEENIRRFDVPMDCSEGVQVRKAL